MRSGLGFMIFDLADTADLYIRQACNSYLIGCVLRAHRIGESSAGAINSYLGEEPASLLATAPHTTRLRKPETDIRD